MKSMGGVTIYLHFKGTLIKCFAEYINDIFSHMLVDYEMRNL